MKRCITTALLTFALLTCGHAKADGLFKPMAVFSIFTAIGSAVVHHIAAPTSDAVRQKVQEPVIVPAGIVNDASTPETDGPVSEVSVPDAGPTQIDVVAETQRRYVALKPEVERMQQQEGGFVSVVADVVGGVASGFVAIDSAAAQAGLAKHFQ